MMKGYLKGVQGIPVGVGPEAGFARVSIQTQMSYARNGPMLSVHRGGITHITSRLHGIEEGDQGVKTTFYM